MYFGLINQLINEVIFGSLDDKTMPKKNPVMSIFHVLIVHTVLAPPGTYTLKPFQIWGKLSGPTLRSLLNKLTLK